MDAQSVGSQMVHNFNKLTVIASESYKDFVADLQRQIKTDLYERPRKASIDYFQGKIAIKNGIPEKITQQQAAMIYQYMIRNDYISSDGEDHVTEQYVIDLENNKLAPLPESLTIYADSIHKLIQSVFNDKILDDMIEDGNETKILSNSLNDNFIRKNSRHYGDILIISMHTLYRLTVKN